MYESRTKLNSMAASRGVASSTGLPQWKSLCLNRVGKPCNRCNCSFNALTSLRSGSGMLATSPPDSIVMRSIGQIPSGSNVLTM